jgi:hypothetical protein
VTTVTYHADAAVHPSGAPGPLDGITGPVATPPLVGREGGLWLEEEGHGDE